MKTKTIVNNITLLIHDGEPIKLGDIRVTIEKVARRTHKRTFELPNKYKEKHPYILQIKSLKFVIDSYFVYEKDNKLMASVIHGPVIGGFGRNTGFFL